MSTSRSADQIAIGDEVPSWTMDAVEAARMKTMAAILRDPYPVHWDREANSLIGLGDRVVNQGPLNVGYIANMLMAWAGPSSVRRLTLSFGRPVLDGDSVIAHGVVTSIEQLAGATPSEAQTTTAVCDVWLQRGDERVVTGTAIIDTTAITRSITPSQRDKDTDL